MRTFITATVIYFSLALQLCALMNVPTQTRAALAVQLVVLGLGGTGYSLSHLRRLRGFHRNGILGRGDWVWNLALPLLATLCLAGTALGLSRSVAGGLDAAAVGTLMLVTVGIHNAWSVTLYLARRTPS